MNWWHHLTNPHCSECLQEGLDSKVCLSCETLKQQLDIANQTNMQLIEKITHVPAAPVITENEVLPKPLGRRFIPHAVKREMMMREDQKTATLMRDKMKELREAGIDTSKVVVPIREVKEANPTEVINDKEDDDALENELLRAAKEREAGR